MGLERTSREKKGSMRITRKSFHACTHLPGRWISVHPNCRSDVRKAKRSDGLQRLEMAAQHTKGESLYDDENIAMAKDRYAGSRHRDEHGFDGLGPGSLSDPHRWIDLAVHGDTLQPGFLSRMDRTR